MAQIIEWINSLTNNYIITITIAVLIANVVIIPFSILQKKNQTAQIKAMPEVKAIQKKYGANILGVSQDANDLSDEIKAMPVDQRDELMNKEISDAYKKTGYKGFVGWLPGIITIVLIVLLYAGISGAVPEGDICSWTFKDVMNKADRLIPTLLLFSSMIWTLLYTAATSAINIYKAIKAGKGVKGTVITGVITFAIEAAITTYIVLNSTIAINYAIFALGASRTVLNSIEGMIGRGKKQAGVVGEEAVA